MKVFIAGATGLLGKRVIKLLLERGHGVVGLSRSEANRALLSSMGAEARPGNLFDKNEMTAATEGCDAILHLATKIPPKTRTTPKDWRENGRIRMEGADNLTEAAIHNKARLYLQQSILFIYGDQQGRVIDGQTRLAKRQPFPLRSAVAMENIVNAKAREEGLPAITLRFAGFYGPDSAQTQGMIQAVRKGKMPVIGRGDYYYNLIHLDDAASAVAFAVDNHERLMHQAHNVSDFHPATFAEVIHYLAELTGAGKPRHFPAWLGRLFLGGALVEILTNSYQNRTNTLAGWQPAYPSYREGFEQVASRINQT
ncbi:MAG: NAD-dependent epimerase/dehydratase family protein [Phaeodactylibacter sp.]|nr:NAD-dependent epimerase/dehydratase family protein [Phaeodactylibacter sp.]